MASLLQHHHTTHSSSSQQLGITNITTTSHQTERPRKQGRTREQGNGKADARVQEAGVGVGPEELKLGKAEAEVECRRRRWRPPTAGRIEWKPCRTPWLGFATGHESEEVETRRRIGVDGGSYAEQQRCATATKEADGSLISPTVTSGSRSPEQARKNGKNKSKKRRL